MTLRNRFSECASGIGSTAVVPPIGQSVVVSNYGSVKVDGIGWLWRSVHNKVGADGRLFQAACTCRARPCCEVVVMI